MDRGKICFCTDDDIGNLNRYYDLCAPTDMGMYWAAGLDGAAGRWHFYKIILDRDEEDLLKFLEALYD